jgi:membrane protein DedA with SNARE-associated domain
VNLERGQPPSTTVVRLVIGAVIVSWAAALAGDLFAAYLIDQGPNRHAVLVGLTPRLRYLVSAPESGMSVVTYGVVGFVRLVASDPLYYLLGFWYGDRALAWVERRSRTYGPMVRDGERMFRKIALVLIFAVPNNIICALAGASGVGVGVFLLLNITGTIFRLVLSWTVGELLEAQVESAVGFVGNYRPWFFALSAIAVAYAVFVEFRGDNSELKTLSDLANDDGGDDAGESGGATLATDEGAGGEPGSRAEST